MAVVEIDPKLIVRDSSVRGAIPILPMPLATFCFVLNLLVPGLGNYQLLGRMLKNLHLFFKIQEQS